MYILELSENTPDEIAKNYWLSTDLENKRIKRLTSEFFLNVAKNKDFIDNIYKGKLKESWTFDRIGSIEKSILRVALYELLNGKTPFYAILSDYNSIATEYGDEKIASFIHGILIAVKNEYGTDRK
jgi:N utilization substance protein B